MGGRSDHDNIVQTSTKLPQKTEPEIVDHRSGIVDQASGERILNPQKQSTQVGMKWAQALRSECSLNHRNPTPQEQGAIELPERTNALR